MDFTNHKKDAERIYSIFGELSQNVIDELLDATACGSDFLFFLKNIVFNILLYALFSAN